MYKRLLRYLEDELTSSGWFPSYSQDGTAASLLPTAYFTLLIGSTIDHPRINQKIARYAQANLSPDGTCNYWEERESKFAAFQLPDDWDDTALAHSCLQKSTTYQNCFPFQLLKQHVTERGIQTWILPRGYLQQHPSWEDYDPGVACNVLFLLAKNRIFLPTIWNQVVSSFLVGESRSKYYLDNNLLTFFIARTANLYRHQPDQELVVKKVQQEVRRRTPCEVDTTLSHAAHLAACKELRISIASKYLHHWSKIFLSSPRLEPAILGWNAGTSSKVFDCCPALTAALLVHSYTPRVPAGSYPHSPSQTRIAKTTFGREISQIPRDVRLLTQSKKNAKEEGQATGRNLRLWLYYYTYDARRDGDRVLVPSHRLVRSDCSHNQHLAAKAYHSSAPKILTPRATLNLFSDQHQPYLAAVADVGGSPLLKTYQHYLHAKQLSDDILDHRQDQQAGRTTYVTTLRERLGRREFQMQTAHLVLYECSIALSILRRFPRHQSTTLYRNITALMTISHAILRRNRECLLLR